MEPVYVLPAREGMQVCFLSAKWVLFPTRTKCKKAKQRQRDQTVSGQRQPAWLVYPHNPDLPRFGSHLFTQNGSSLPSLPHLREGFAVQTSDT